MTKELRAHVWDRDEHDHYVEETWVSRRLFEMEVFKGHVHDPACGFGNIVASAISTGHKATGSDICNRSDNQQSNFLESKTKYANIVCNPPFEIIEEFTKAAVNLSKLKTALIFPTRRLNAAGAWLQSLPLSCVWFLTPRPSMPPGSVYKELLSKGRKAGGGTQDFCWVVFNKEHRGTAQMRWLHRDEGKQR
jgi:hypothetical protein